MARTYRTANFDIEFGGLGEVAEGWCLPVPVAFRPRLDIFWTERRKKKQPYYLWTQGVPADFSFSEGDAVIDPVEARIAPWGTVPVRLYIQVVPADETVPKGHVPFDLYRGFPGKVAPERHVMSQNAFVLLLRKGVADCDGKRLDLRPLVPAKA
jgi:hypothetical protein